MGAAKENPAPGGNRDGAGISNYSGADFNAPIDKLLSRLDGVKQTGPDRYVARCTSHEDRHPSLSLRELPDRRVLLHCFAGCPAAEVLGAVGLTLADLFEKPVGHHAPAARRPWRDAGLEAIRALADEVAVLFVMAVLMAGGLKLTAADRDRLALAAERINGALLMIEGGRGRG